VCGIDPLRVYMYKDGLCRLSTVKYQTPAANNLGNLCMHLTNYAINKSNKDYEKNTEKDQDDKGHKRSLNFTLKFIKEKGHDPDLVMANIKQTIIKSLITVQPSLAHTYKSCQPDDVENSMCFEILGFDIFLDENLKPWVLEVNHAPSFVCDTPLDTKIKRGLIFDAMRLLNLSVSKKNKFKREKAKEFEKRALKGKKRITQEQR
jgi:tubulin polyglutamylase TTLL6/13